MMPGGLPGFRTEHYGAPPFDSCECFEHRRIRALEARVKELEADCERHRLAAVDFRAIAEKAEVDLAEWKQTAERREDEITRLRSAGRESGESAREAAERSETADDPGRAVKRGGSCGLDTPDFAAAKPAVRTISPQEREALANESEWLADREQVRLKSAARRNTETQECGT